MKIQDVLFVVIFLALILRRVPRDFVWVGLGCLCLAIPLFAHWIFFTAERLTWYATICFVTFILISIGKLRRVQ